MKKVLIALSLALMATGCGNKENKPAAKPAAEKAAPAAPKAEAAPAAEAAKPADAAPAAATATASADAAAPAGGAAAEAKQIFTSRCVSCHGANGQGDGVAAAALNPKPRAYSDKEWQASVTDEHIAKVIVEGGAAVGKSALMPPNPDLASKKEVVDALVAMIRAYGK